jgi:hypothetical protein
MGSTSSSATPAATTPVDHPTERERQSAVACKASLFGSSEDTYSASDELDRHLKDVAIGAIILYFFCVWEFSIGIKQSIKKLFKVHFVLDICRYIAYIVPVGHGDESAKNSETRTDHSGSGRRKLD